MNARRQALKTIARTAAVGVPVWLSSAGAMAKGLTSDTVTIGSSLGLSGATAAGGAGHVAGIQAALHEINSAGGINGRQVRFLYKDDGYDPKRSVENLTPMIEDGTAFALVSIVGTGANQAINPLVERAGMPLVGPITGADSLRNAEQRFTFHIRPSYYNEVEYMVNQLAFMGMHDLAVVYLDNAFGKEILGYTKTAFAKASTRAVAEIALARDGKNAQECANQVLKSKAGAVILATTGGATTDFVLAVRQQAAGLPLVGLSLTFNDGKRLGKNTTGLASTLVFPPFRATQFAIVRRFWASMQAAKQDSQASSALESWWNTQVLCQALRRAGRDPTREKLRDALASTRNFRMDELSVSFPSRAPYVGMKLVTLGVYSPDGNLRS
ncbi:MAG: ABC transporter substrate-binding protein [Ramlibacter sp.]|nr:ABC transporter substrate-binding protein [Ramlibacter sp.]